MSFHSITLEDKEWVTPLLRESDFRGCDYTFGNLFIWKDFFQAQIACVEDMVCYRIIWPGTKQYKYLYPAGTGNLQAAIQFMMEDAKKNQSEFLLRGFEKSEMGKLEEVFPGRFHFESIRNEWDYLYSVEDLTNLAGKKYHGKRNHISKFESTGEWRFVPLDSTNIDACRKMCCEWYREHMEAGNTAAQMDKGVVENALHNYQELGFTGGVLYQFEQVVAFTVGEPLSSDTYVTHIEKAFADINGAYPMINREYVKVMMQDYKYVNREEDDGLEGLRKAKESYQPTMMVEKYTATLNERRGAICFERQCHRTITE